MPEVFTAENKEYYRSGLSKQSASLTCDEVLKYREYYVNHSMSEVFKKMCEEKGDNFLKESTFSKIITGDVRDNSLYKTVPIYKKREKKWIKD